MPRATVRKSPKSKSKSKEPAPYHHGDLRHALEDAALALIAEVGPEGFTLREVARRTGVSHAAPYRHFRDKRALMTTLAAQGAERLGQRISRALERAGPDLRARFLAGGHEYVLFAVQENARFRVTFFSTEVDADDPAMIAARERSFGTLLRFIDEAQRARFFPPGDPMQLATAIWAMHHGLATLASMNVLDEAKGPSLRAIVDHAHERLLDGLIARSSSGRRAKSRS